MVHRKPFLLGLTHLLIIHQLGDRRVLAAEGAVLVPDDIELAEGHIQRIEHQETPDQGIALTRKELYRLKGLYHAYDPRDGTDDAGLLA